MRSQRICLAHGESSLEATPATRRMARSWLACALVEQSPTSWAVGGQNELVAIEAVARTAMRASRAPDQVRACVCRRADDTPVSAPHVSARPIERASAYTYQSCTPISLHSRASALARGPRGRWTEDVGRPGPAASRKSQALGLRLANEATLPTAPPSSRRRDVRQHDVARSGHRASWELSLSLVPRRLVGEGDVGDRASS